MYPIFLFHGFLGYRRFFLWELYKGVVEALEARGIRAIRTLVHPTASIQERAAEILQIVHREIGASQPFHIIAHSMGGLDARYLVSPHGLDQGHRTITLTTISTPHRGSCLADNIPESLRILFSEAALVGSQYILSEEERTFLSAIAENRWEALAQLKPAYMENEFNPKIIDAPTVRYYSYAGKLDMDRITLITILRGSTWQYIKEREGENDGLVSIQSAQWGDFKGILPAEHSEQIGLQINPWCKNSFDHLQLFYKICEEIKLAESETRQPESKVQH